MNMPVRIRRVVGVGGEGLPAPLWVDSSAVYPYSARLEHQFIRKSRYGDLVSYGRVFVKDGVKYFSVPREMAPRSIDDRRAEGLHYLFKSLFVPRNEDQARAVDKAGKLLATERSFILEAPTGSGKTACAMALLSVVNRKTMVVVTKEDIRDQWIEAAKKFCGLEAEQIGLIQGATFDVKNKPFVVAMIQTLSREGKFHADQLKDFGFVIFDEVHRVGADQFANACWILPAKIRLGLSATPTRKDGREEVVFGHIGKIEVRITAMRLKPKVLVVETGWQIPKVPKRLANKRVVLAPIPHSPGRINHINKLLAQSRERNLLIAKFVDASLQKERRVIVFSELKEHLDSIAGALRSVGVATSDMAYYVGGIKKAEREAAKQKKVILATYAYCAEATDIPWLDTLVLGTPRSDVIQIVGRILREYDGKMNPVVLDLVDRSSPVFDGYAGKRIQWYHRIGADVQFMFPTEGKA